jgi:hypothetical protein
MLPFLTIHIEDPMPYPILKPLLNQLPLWVVVEVGFENPFHIGRVCCESVVDVHHGHGVGQEALEVVQQPVMQHIEMRRLLQDAAENWPGLGS